MLFFSSRTQPASYVANADCSELCSGGTYDCGAASHVSVYKSPVHTLGFKMRQDPVQNVTAGTTADFSVSYYLGKRFCIEVVVMKVMVIVVVVVVVVVELVMVPVVVVVAAVVVVEVVVVVLVVVVVALVVAAVL